MDRAAPGRMGRAALDREAGGLDQRVAEAAAQQDSLGRVLQSAQDAVGPAGNAHARVPSVDGTYV